tara:strand:- start:169 stop:507 length:339 start_codon:yes stop_codon:yes gene_type:complete
MRRFTNWEIVNAMQESAKVTSDDTWETILGVDPLYILDKELLKQRNKKEWLLSLYQILRKGLGTPTPTDYSKWVDDMAWCAFREDSIENNRQELNKMQEEYRNKLKNGGGEE